MSKDLLLAIETVANEKGINKDLVFEAMQDALASVVKKATNQDANISVSIDQVSGEFKAKRLWDVVAEDHDPMNYASEMYEDVAREKGFDVVIGDVVSQDVEIEGFGRIAASTVKQVLTKKIRLFERENLANIYKDKIGSVAYGEVKRVTYDNLVIDLGDNAEGLLSKRDLILRERFRVGDKIKCCVESVEPDEDGRLSTIVLSRSSETMIKALFELEVPEVEEELVNIVNIAREPGFRSKVSVKSNDQRIDPCGACVGVRGSRIHSVMDELNGERIDVVLWDENIVQHAINALSPVDAEDIIEVSLDEESGSMDIVIKKESLSKAIGKNGINVRLASALVGWRINVLSDAEQEEKQISIVEKFIEALDVEEDFAIVLVEEGIETLNDLAYIDKSDLLEIEGFDEDLVDEIQERAKSALLKEALSDNTPKEDLLSLEGMTDAIAKELASNGVCSMEDLAELSVDEVLEFVKIDEKKASDLIIKARAPWFE